MVSLHKTMITKDKYMIMMAIILIIIIIGVSYGRYEGTGTPIFGLGVPYLHFKE